MWGAGDRLSRRRVVSERDSFKWIAVEAPVTLQIWKIDPFVRFR